MENKKSFILYADYKHTVNLLGDERSGKLFKTILSYVNDENPQVDDEVVKVAFEPIKQQLKRDLKGWVNKKTVRAEAGRKGGLAKSSNAKQKVAKLAVNVTDTVTVNVSKDIYRAFNHLSISQKEYLKLLEDFKKENIDDVLDSIQNYNQNKKYKSLYLTAKNWLKRDYQKNISTPDPLVNYVKSQLNDYKQGK